jgi:hypothetical protein
MRSPNPNVDGCEQAATHPPGQRPEVLAPGTPAARSYTSSLQKWLLSGSVVQVAEQAAGVGSAMAYNFLACDRDQAFLLPPDVRDWLPSDHLAWFVLDVVDQLDLDPFLAAYRADGHGRAAYEPRMLLGVLLYGYRTGSAPPARSSGAAGRPRLPGPCRQQHPLIM